MTLIAGVDEAGRGPLAGPVVAAAVVLPASHTLELRDSKKLTARARERLYNEIRLAAVAYAIVEVDVATIDQINILQATLSAMKQAVEQLNVEPDAIRIDGSHCPEGLIGDVEAVVGGDDLIPAISAASILAKVWRDRYMLNVHQAYPLYGFDRHKGYGTAAHMQALRTYGPCPHHRQSFAPVRRCQAPQPA